MRQDFHDGMQLLELSGVSTFSPERAEQGSLAATENEVWIGNFNVKARKTTEHILHKTWHSLKFSKKFRKTREAPNRPMLNWLKSFV